MDMEQGLAAGLGITIDPEGEAVIIVMIQTGEQQVAVPMTPEVALAFSRTMREMAREAQTLQDEMEDLSPEEIPDRLMAIQNRYNRNGDGT
jgi:hypothetical protein